MRLNIPAWLNARGPLFLILSAMLALGGAKVSLINDFGSDVPFGDQWYGEVACTYAPWLNGDFTVATLFAPHNEHRIVFTRLLDLTLLALTGQWDPRLQLTVDVLLLLAAVAVLLWHSFRKISPLQQAILAILSVLSFGSATLWENTLNGFQSQFYFLLLFSLLHVLQTIEARPFSARWWLGSIAGFANLFTMAPGLLSASAVLGWLAWRCFRCGRHETGDIYTAGWNVILLITGWILLPASALTTGLYPATPPELGEVFLRLLSWPVVQWQFGLLVWAPAVLFAGRNLLGKPTGKEQGWLVALLLLAFLFVLATAVGRGGLASRYEDLFSLGILVNWLCLATWPAKGRWRIMLSVFGTLWCIIIAQGLWQQEKVARSILPQEAANHQSRTVAIRQFLATGSTTTLRQGDQFSPLDIGVLESIRTSPLLRDILPFSIRQPLGIRVASNTSVFQPEGAPMLNNAMTAVPVWGNWGSAANESIGEWKSEPLATKGALLVFFVAGEISPPLTELFLQTAEGGKIVPLQPATSARDQWHRVNFINPGQPFEIVARANSAERRLAFSAPFEQARSSWLMGKMMRILRVGSILVITGWVLLLGVSATTLFVWLGGEESPMPS